MTLTPEVIEYKERPYLPLEKIDEILSKHPFVKSKWLPLADDDKDGYYFLIYDLIENHRWKGTALHTPMQSAAFPRKIGNLIIRWDTDPEVEINHRQFVENIHRNEGSWYLRPILSFFRGGYFFPIIPLPLHGSNENQMNLHVLPSHLIAHAIGSLLQEAQFQELRALRNIGVTYTKTGPIEAGFGQGSQGARSGTVSPTLGPLGGGYDWMLPDPLWRSMRNYSLEYNPGVMTDGFGLQRQ